jgi:hypothetical protein
MEGGMFQAVPEEMLAEADGIKKGEERKKSESRAYSPLNEA